MRLHLALRAPVLFALVLASSLLSAAEPAPLRTARLAWEPVPARPDVQRAAAALAAAGFSSTP